MPTHYPTERQIMQRPHTHRPEVIRLVRAWKREFAGRRRSPEAIEVLLERLGTAYKKPVRLVTADRVADHYQPQTHTIVLNTDRLSVVTALHEFAHHLYGPSETKACRWSVWLFRKTFRRTFDRCQFDGHMLRLPRSDA